MRNVIDKIKYVTEYITLRIDEDGIVLALKKSIRIENSSNVKIFI